jgi:hypothetical protein
MFRAEGTVEAIGRGVIQILTDSNQPWMVWVAPEAKIHVVGTAEADFVRPGMFIRFTTEVDKRTKGRITEKVEELTIFTPFRGPSDAVGLWPEGTGPADGKEGATESDDPFGGVPDDQAAGGRPPMSQLYTIAGQITGNRRGRMTVDTGRGVFRFELADEPKIAVDIVDYIYAKKGDKVSIPRGKKYIGQIGRAMAEELKIKLSEPLTTTKKKPARTKKTSKRPPPQPDREQPEKEPADAEE